MTIRPYNIKDISVLSELFFETVHAVNSRDYCEEQLFAWAPSRDCLLARAEEFAAQNCLVAEEDGRVVGFAGMEDGHLDMLYVHRDEQSRGIATALCNELERGQERITTFASLTAKGFFERRGYVAIKRQTVERRGVLLDNFIMVKQK